MSPYVDWGEVNEEQGEFAPIPNGEYEAELTDQDRREGDKGPYYALTYTLTEEAGEFKNRKVWQNASISPGGAWKFKQVMLALGAERSDMSVGSEVDTDDIVAGVVGAKCRLRLKQKNYTKNDGKPGIRSEVMDVKSVAFVV
jgi:hypothetical protein